MTRTLRFVVGCIILTLSAITLFGQAAANTKPEDTSASVSAAMRTIRAAVASGDAEQWKALVAEKCIFIEPNGRRTSRDWHLPSKPTTASPISVKTDLSGLAVQDFGETAVLTYVETMHVQVGETSTRTVTRFTETYQRAPKGWRLIASAETPVPQRQAIKIDPKLLDDYLGEYQIAPGLVGKVFREGDKLRLIGTGWKQSYELVPLARDSFFVREFENTEIAFVRDSTGAVTEHISKTDGQEMRAKKLKP